MPVLGVNNLHVFLHFTRLTIYTFCNRGSTGAAVGPPSQINMINGAVGRWAPTFHLPTLQQHCEHPPTNSHLSTLPSTPPLIHHARVRCTHLLPLPVDQRVTPQRCPMTKADHHGTMPPSPQNTTCITTLSHQPPSYPQLQPLNTIALARTLHLQRLVKATSCHWVVFIMYALRIHTFNSRTITAVMYSNHSWL